MTTRKPLIDSSKLASTKCIIGQLRQCLEDEDCVENPSAEPTPEVKVVVTSPNGTANQVVHSRTFLTKSPNSGTFERIGSCTCRDVRQCKRTQQQQHSRNIVPTSENGKLADKRGNKGGKLGKCFSYDQFEKLANSFSLILFRFLSRHHYQPIHDRRMQFCYILLRLSIRHDTKHPPATRTNE